MEDDFQSILERGINFGKGGQKKSDSDKVKTKAKKKKYITGPCKRRSIVSRGRIGIRASEDRHKERNNREIRT